MLGVGLLPFCVAHALPAAPAALAAREATLETPPEGYGYIFHVDNASCDLAFELGEVVR